MLEAQMHQETSFLTLTYDPKYYPKDGSIRKVEMQLFIKRLRKELGEAKIRYYGVGEYGEKTERAHYHAIIFGHDFSDDRRAHSQNELGDTLYTSAQLDRVWQLGHASIGDVTFKSAAYCARYVMKKLNETAGAPAPYGDREPPFALMSRKPGIGKPWYDLFYKDTKKDFVTIDGKRYRIPPYFDKLFDKQNPEEYDVFVDEHGKKWLTTKVKLSELDKVKGRRIRESKKYAHDNTPERLAVKAEVLDSKLKKLRDKL